MSNKILISVCEQKLQLLDENNCVIKTYPISTAEAGISCMSDSDGTPVGIHKIHSKIGDGCPLGTIFKARKDTKKIAIIYKKDPEETINTDLILTRIIRLEGTQEKVNKGNSEKGNNVDSFKRFIYIHGTQKEYLIGTPASHGCIRMNNDDVIELFDQVDLANEVNIIP